MKRRMFLGFVTCTALIMLLTAGFGLAQGTQPASTPSDQLVSLPGTAQPALAIPAGVAWRQRLGEDDTDNYRIQRRPGEGEAWVKLFTVDKWGNAIAKGRVAAGGDVTTRMEKPAANALNFYVADELVLHLHGGGAHNFVAGDSWNQVTAGMIGAAIGGGGDGSKEGGNKVTGSYGVVSGGRENIAYQDAAVGGGLGNRATGFSAVVPGGVFNTASGSSSFAAGNHARAYHSGSFVWGDSTLNYINSSGVDQFIVRANGGLWLGKATRDLTPTIAANEFITTSTGAYLSTGGVWSYHSDAASKEGFSPAQTDDVLARLAAMPISTWQYTAEEGEVSHMGPTAQDFYAAFGLGQDDKHISTVDADGVALAAIQALAEKNAALEARVVELEALVKELLAKQSP